MSVCPYCDKLVPRATDPALRPFCSQRCKLADLGQWFSGAYAIPGETGPESPGPDPTPLKPQ